VATSIDYAQAALVLVLFFVGLVGARRSGLSWARALAWGCTDVAVAIVIVALKEVESLLIH
jgi:VIT1/CCC1 family predicted Fe2+/Mn2+ transporter